MTDEKPWWDSPFINWRNLDEDGRRYLANLNERYYRRLIAQGERRVAKEREKEAHKQEIERRKIERQKAREAIKTQKAEEHKAEVLRRKAERDALRAKAREEKKKQKEQEKEERKRQRAEARKLKRKEKQKEKQDEIEADLAAAHEAMDDPFDFGPDIDERDKKRARRYEAELGEKDYEYLLDELGEEDWEDDEEEEETVLSLADQTIIDASNAPLHAYVYAENRGSKQRESSRQYMISHDFNNFMSSYEDYKVPLRRDSELMDVDEDEDDPEERKNWEALARNSHSSAEPLAKVVFMFFRIRQSFLTRLDKKDQKRELEKIKKGLLPLKPPNMKKGETEKWIRGLNQIKIFDTASGQAYVLDPVNLVISRNNRDQMAWESTINYYDIQHGRTSRFHDDRVIADFGMPQSPESFSVIAIPAKYVVFFQRYINELPPYSFEQLFGRSKPVYDEESSDTELDKTPFYFMFTPIYTNAILEFDPRYPVEEQQTKIFTFAYVRKYGRGDGQYTHWREQIERTPGFYMAHGKINGKK